MALNLDKAGDLAKVQEIAWAMAQEVKTVMSVAQAMAQARTKAMDQEMADLPTVHHKDLAMALEVPTAMAKVPMAMTVLTREKSPKQIQSRE